MLACLSKPSLHKGQRSDIATTITGRYKDVVRLSLITYNCQLVISFWICDDPYIELQSLIMIYDGFLYIL